MGDIEDSAQSLTEADMDRTRKEMIFPKTKRTSYEGEEKEIRELSNNANNSIPGVAKVWVKTFGCSHNLSDSEYMSVSCLIHF